MIRKLITSKPDINDQGVKRWFIGDLEDGAQKVYVFEKARDPAVVGRDYRFMLRVFTLEAEVVHETFFHRRYTLARRLCRLFDVDIIELSDNDSLPEAA